MTAPRRLDLSEDALKWCVRSAVSDPLFWEKVRAEGDCLVYTGHRDRQGYGVVMRKAVSPSPILAHRYVWYLTHGAFRDGLVIRHSCDNPPCVRPDHLKDGTQADNIADRQARGRHRPGWLHGEQHPQAKIADSEVAFIRRAVLRGERQIDLARFFGLHPSTVSHIVTGRNWKHVA